MADIRDLGTGGGVDVTRGVRTGLDILGGVEGIQRGRAGEKRAAETFELNKQVAEQDLAIRAQQEKERQEDKNIDKLERRYEIAVKQKNFEAADEIRFKWGEASGIHIGGDHEEIANLLSERRQAVKAKDKETVSAVDDYLSEVRRITPEEAAGLIGLTTEAEGFKAERTFGQKLREEEESFAVKEERRKLGQAETVKATTEALEDIEGLDDTTKALLPLIASGQITGAVLNQIAGQTGVTFRQGIEGTGVNKKKTVTAVFNKQGKKLAEFPEAGVRDKAQRRIFETEDPLTGEKSIKGVVWSEDANGNPILQFITPQEPEEVRPVVAEDKSVEAIKTELEKLGSAGELTPEAFLDSITNIEELTGQQIVDAYKRALEEQGGAAKKGAPAIRKGTGKGFLERLLGPRGKGRPVTPLPLIPEQEKEEKAGERAEERLL